ncbi:MAG TPA: DUF2530 domain-containing protein [Mycobacteriales bacterium]|nr:DUF2530 domain-containing protein [Mycobacteriales bacterium]
MERRPDPAPLETNDVAIVTGGTVLWAVALVVLLVLKAAGVDIRDWWWQMCAAGAALGVLGVRYCRRRRDALAARAQGASGA